MHKDMKSPQRQYVILVGVLFGQKPASKSEKCCTIVKMLFFFSMSLTPQKQPQPRRGLTMQVTHETLEVGTKVQNASMFS